MRWLFSILLVLLVVPGWSGSARLPLLSPDASLMLRIYAPAGGWPRRIGALAPVGAVTLTSGDPAAGSWSALGLRGGRVTLLSDGGNYMRFAIRHGRAIDLRAGFLREGPGTGWEKRDRDSESLAIDPASGAAWAGFERANAIWRYSSDLARAVRHRRPAAMRDWRANSGAESLARLPDGRFVAIAERTPGGKRRRALLFAGDPADRATRVARFTYLPPPGFDPSDAAALPNGDLLVLNRRYRPPLDFAAKLVRIPARALRAGATVRGREIATLAAPLVDENCEGLAVTREGAATMLWIVTDNDSMPLRPSYLFKFRLIDRPRKRPAARWGGRPLSSFGRGLRRRWRRASWRHHASGGAP